MKIRITESEIKKVIKKTLLERYIDEAEKMTVYNQDEFNANLDKITKGTYGIKDKETGKIKSVTVNEEDGDEKWIPKDLKKGRATKLTKGDKSLKSIEDKLSSYDTDPNKKGVQTKSKEDLSKVRALNLAKNFKRGLK